MKKKKKKKKTRKTQLILSLLFSASEPGCIQYIHKTPGYASLNNNISFSVLMIFSFVNKVITAYYE